MPVGVVLPMVERASSPRKDDTIRTRRTCLAAGGVSQGLAHAPSPAAAALRAPHCRPAFPNPAQ
jgi:hypothetical protein